MNNLQPAMRLLICGAVVALAWGGLSSLKKLIYKMAAAAAHAQEHDQLSWNKFLNN